MRQVSASFNGTQLTCVLLSEKGKKPAAVGRRRWDETEECIDPRTGVLRIHSQVPGRYYAYDFSNPVRFGDYQFPQKVIVSEAGRTVTQISVDSLTALPAADPNLFVPTEEMKAKGRAIGMGAARKVWRIAKGGDVPALQARAVCVFGVVTPAGELVEAHSLQPSDPNSAAAVDAARKMNFAIPAAVSASPQQHFVFVIEKFVSSP
ncbi:MAG: hypothetical protein U0Q18_19060 [Bryobacteraceae bacterium]